MVGPEDLVSDVSLDGTLVIASRSRTADLHAVTALAEHERWRTVAAADPEAARRAAAAQKSSLLIVIGDGSHFAIEVVRATRRSATVPVVVIADLDTMTRARLLADGADAVLPTDTGQHELRGWIVALLRRASGTWDPHVRYLSAPGLQVDLWSRTCQLRGADVALSPTEFQLLVYLMRNPHKALPNHKIARQLWGGAGISYNLNALRIQVSRLRQKISTSTGTDQFIRSVRAVGYEFTQSVLELGEDAQAAADPELASLDLPLAVLEVADGLLGQRGAHAASYLTEVLRSNLPCDAAAVFQRRGDWMKLVAESGNSQRWRTTMRDGIPLRSGFAQVEAIRTRRPTQITDLFGQPHGYRETARALADGGYRSCLFVPIVTATGSWGGLGLASRSPRPFDAATTTFCVAATAMFALTLA